MPGYFYKTEAHKLQQAPSLPSPGTKGARAEMRSTLRELRSKRRPGDSKYTRQSIGRRRSHRRRRNALAKISRRGSR